MTVLRAWLNPAAQPGNASANGGAANSGNKPNQPDNGKAPVPGVMATPSVPLAVPSCPPNPGDPNQNPPADPVYLSFGTVYVSAEDLTGLPFRGQTGTATLGFNRFYSSGAVAQGNDTTLGVGWTHNYNILLTVNVDGSVKITQWDGREMTFTNTGAYTYRSPIGVSSTLSQPGGSNFIWRLQHGTSYIFRTDNNALATIKDRQGNYVNLAYTGAYLTTVTDSAGRPLTLTYTGTHITQVTDNTRTVSYGYDGANHLQTVSDSIGTRVTYYYGDNDANHPHHLTRMVDGRGKTHRYVYDAGGAVAYETNALNKIQNYAWDWANWGWP
jgi:YD repeat-containing protein